MTIAYSTALRNARADEITNAIGSSGLLRIYSGTRPASGGTATTLLGELALAATAAPAASAGVLTFSAIVDDPAAASGDATWFRITTSAGTFVIDGDVRESADPNNGEELVLDEKTIVLGGVISVSSLVVTQGNA